MPAPKPPRRKKNIDHVVEAVLALEQAELVLGRIDDAKLSNTSRDAVRRLGKAITDGKRAAADAIEEMTEGTLTRRPASSQPLFSDQRGS